MPALNSAQFHQLANSSRKPDEGFSVNVPTGHNAPTHGYMVSVPGAEEVHKADEHVTGAHLENFARAQEGPLSRRGNYMGGWREPVNDEEGRRQPGSLYLDVSHRYASHDRARAAMFAGDQHALFKLEHGESEQNYELRGTQGTSLEHIIPDEGAPAAQYAALRRAARDKLSGRRGRAGEIFSGR